MRLPASLRLYLGQTALWTAVCAAFELVCRFLLHWGFPYDYPFVPRKWIFGDFHDNCSKFFLFHSRAFFGYGPVLPYPAPTLALYKIYLPASTLQLHYPVSTSCFLASIIVSALVMLAFFYRALIGRGLAPRAAAVYCSGIFLFSFPFWFELHQANIEFAVWAILAIGLWAHWTSRSWLASLCFGTAAAMKLFPLILLGLLLAKKQYRQLALSLVIAGFVTLAGLWLVCPDIAYSWHQTNAAIDTMRDIRMLHIPPIVSGFDHTLWLIIKLSLQRLTPAQLNRVLTLYLGITALTGIVLFFVRIVKLPVVNQILCLSIASILLPPVSYDYTLVHLYAPFVLITFVALRQRDKPTLALQVALGLFAFLLSWQEEFILHGERFAGALKAVALFALFILSLTQPFDLEPGVNGQSAIPDPPPSPTSLALE